MTEQQRTGSTRAVVPASIRSARRTRTVSTAIAGSAIAAFALAALAQPLLASDDPAEASPHHPSLEQISADQSQEFKADLNSAVHNDAQQAGLVSRGGGAQADLEPEPTPEPQTEGPAHADSNSGGNSGGAPSYPEGGSYDPGSVQAMAKEVLAENGQADQWGCFDAIISQESGWNPYATNPYSGAYGLPQALPGSKMASAGADWETNPRTQVKWALGYMNERYGSPCGAYDFKFTQGNGWY